METRSYLAVPGDCATMSAGSATLYNCAANAPRLACGKALFGPLMVRSEAPFELSIKEPVPAPGRRGFLTLTDACGQQIPMPVSGQEFYLALPTGAPASRYRLTLSSGGDSSAVEIALGAGLEPPKARIVVPWAGKGMKLKKGYR